MGLFGCLFTSDEEYLQKNFPILRPDWEDNCANSYRNAIGKRVLMGLSGTYFEADVLEVRGTNVKLRRYRNEKVSSIGWQFVGFYDICSILGDTKEPLEIAKIDKPKSDMEIEISTIREEIRILTIKLDKLSINKT